MTKPEYERRMMAMAVTIVGKSIRDDQSWRVGIDDDGAGEYIVVTGGGQPDWSVDKVEWPYLRDAIDQMMDECRGKQ